MEFSFIEVGKCNFTIKEFNQRFFFQWILMQAITPANFRLDEEEYTHLSHTSWEDVLKKISQVLVFHHHHHHNNNNNNNNNNDNNNNIINRKNDNDNSDNTTIIIIVISVGEKLGN